MRKTTVVALLVLAALVLMAVGVTAQDEDKQATDDKKFKGVITERTKDSLTVEREKENGETAARTFVVTERTKFVVDEKEVKPAEFKKGMTVVVKYRKADKDLIAKRVTKE